MKCIHVYSPILQDYVTYKKCIHVYSYILTVQNYGREGALIFKIYHWERQNSVMFHKCFLNMVTHGQNWSKPQKIWLSARWNTTGMCWFHSRSPQVQTSYIPFAAVTEIHFSMDMCVLTSTCKAAPLSYLEGKSEFPFENLRVPKFPKWPWLSGL